MSADAGETLVLHAYNVEVAELLEETEGHADALVRSLRKLVIQATLALKAALAADHTPDDVPAAEATDAPGPVIDLSPPTVRAWAAAQGIVVSATGRVPKHVLDLYVEHHTIAEAAS